MKHQLKKKTYKQKLLLHIDLLELCLAVDERRLDDNTFFISQSPHFLDDDTFFENTSKFISNIELVSFIPLHLKKHITSDSSQSSGIANGGAPGVQPGSGDCYE